jgi:hypothetical protein
LQPGGEHPSTPSGSARRGQDNSASNEERLRAAAEPEPGDRIEGNRKGSTISHWENVDA